MSEGDLELFKKERRRFDLQYPTSLAFSWFFSQKLSSGSSKHRVVETKGIMEVFQFPSPYITNKATPAQGDQVFVTPFPNQPAPPPTPASRSRNQRWKLCFCIFDRKDQDLPIFSAPSHMKIGVFELIACWLVQHYL